MLGIERGISKSGSTPPSWITRCSLRPMSDPGTVLMRSNCPRINSTSRGDRWPCITIQSIVKPMTWLTSTARSMSRIGSLNPLSPARSYRRMPTETSKKWCIGVTITCSIYTSGSARLLIVPPTRWDVSPTSTDYTDWYVYWCPGGIVDLTAHRPKIRVNAGLPA